MTQSYEVAGARWSALSAGIKKSRNGEAPPLDLALLELSEASTLSAVFTRNAFRAAPVVVASERLQAIRTSNRHAKKYLLINSGNANAGTGESGVRAAELSTLAIASRLDIGPDLVLPFSTGVIGEPLSVKPFERNADQLIENLDESNWPLAASAIMTTDTVPKLIARDVKIGDATVRISGLAKGAGMIKPDMATMLAYIVCDAHIPQAALDNLLTKAVGQSFNRITVDGDTSTNDACVMAATAANPIEINEAHSDWSRLEAVVCELLSDLARAIIKDAEGASKFVEVEVVGGASCEECLKVGFTVAESPLVKTAFFASDANWGRILAAIGRAGIEQLDVERVSIYLDDYLICAGGGRLDGYDEDRASAIMSREEVRLRIDLNRGQCVEKIWTSDLSHDYVRINAEYRT